MYIHDLLNLDLVALGGETVPNKWLYDNDNSIKRGPSESESGASCFTTKTLLRIT